MNFHGPVNTAFFSGEYYFIFCGLFIHHMIPLAMPLAYEHAICISAAYNIATYVYYLI